MEQVPQQRGSIGRVANPVPLVNDQTFHGGQNLVVRILLARAGLEVRGIGVYLPRKCVGLDVFFCRGLGKGQLHANPLCDLCQKA